MYFHIVFKVHALVLQWVQSQIGLAFRRSCGGKGCNGYYHLSCLEPPMPDATLGVWHCQFCVRKKIELGVYSVSEGVESICDVKEASFPNVDGTVRIYHYLNYSYDIFLWKLKNMIILEIYT